MTIHAQKSAAKSFFNSLLASQIFVPLDAATISHASKCLWLSVDLLETNSSLAVDAARLRSVWGTSVGPRNTWIDEWHHFGLGRDSDHGWGWGALQSFCGNVLKLELASADAYTANAVLSRSIHEFLKFLKFSGKNVSVKHAIDEIENRARFPILPFYVWSAMDSSPKSFCVSPVWVSQKHFDEFSDGRTRVLGFAISGFKPLLLLDHTVPIDRAWRQKYAADVEPQLVFSLLRLMAKPLVEGTIYDPLFRDIIEHRKSVAKIALGLDPNR